MYTISPKPHQLILHYIVDTFANKYIIYISNKHKLNNITETLIRVNL